MMMMMMMMMTMLRRSVTSSDILSLSARSVVTTKIIRQYKNILLDTCSFQDCISETLQCRASLHAT